MIATPDGAMTEELTHCPLRRDWNAKPPELITLTRHPGARYKAAVFDERDDVVSRYALEAIPVKLTVLALIVGTVRTLAT